MYQVRFPQQSNASDWISTIELKSAIDGTLIDMTGASITLQVWRQTNRGVGTGMYGWDGVYNGTALPVLEATTANGKITVPETGVIQWTFRASELSGLSPGNYEVGMTLTKSPDTIQLLLGELPIVSGAIA